MVRSILFVILVLSVSWVLPTPAFSVEKKSSIEQTLLNALPKDSELNIPSGFNVKPKRKEFSKDTPANQRYLIADWQGYNYYNKRYRKGTGTQKGYDWMMIRFIIWYKHDTFSYKSSKEFRSWHVKNPHHSSNPKEGIRVDWKPWDGLPGAMIADYSNVYTGGHGENINCDIIFLKNPSLRVEVEFSMQINSRIADDWIPPVPFSIRQSQAKAYIRPECERLAKLVWSRLPGGKGDKYVEPPIAGVSTQSDKSGLSSKKEISNTTRDKKGKKLSGIPMEKDSAGLQADDIKDSSEEGSLPPWAPAAAGGVAAGIAAIGSWLMMLSSGIKPKEVWDGVKDLLTQLPIQKELMSKAVDTIDTGPIPAEPSSTQLEPSITPEKPPAEVEKDFFDQAEKEIREKEIAKSPSDDETGAISSSHKDGGGEKPWEKSLDDDEIEHLKGFFALKIEEDGDNLAKDGYWIINPGLSKTIHIASLPFNAIDGRGVSCGDLRNMKMDVVQKWATRQFGDSVIVQSVGVTERSSVIGNGILDTLDSRLEYNHIAIRVIQPNGKAFIVDYYNRLEGGTTIVEEEVWNNMWKYRINEAGGEPYLLTELKSGDELEKPLDAMIQKYGPDRGIEEFYNKRLLQYKDDSKWTVLDEKTGKRDAFLKQTETYIRYIIRNGKKIKH